LKNNSRRRRWFWTADLGVIRERTTSYTVGGKRWLRLPSSPSAPSAGSRWRRCGMGDGLSMRAMTSAVSVMRNPFLVITIATTAALP